MKLLIMCFVSFSALANPVEGKRMAKCPDKPNCVSSLEVVSDDHYIEPMSSFDGIMKRIMKHLSTKDNWKVIKRDGNYIHATETSSVFGFVDDVEFIIIKDKLHFRSASRKGYYDFGVNRKRIEEIKKVLKKDS